MCQLKGNFLYIYLRESEGVTFFNANVSKIVQTENIKKPNIFCQKCQNALCMMKILRYILKADEIHIAFYILNSF